MIVAELQECPEKDVLLAVILFLEIRKISGSHIRWMRRAGNHSYICSSWNFLQSHSNVLQHIVKLYQPVLVLLSFRMFSVDVLPQMLLNLPVVIMLVNCLAWRSKFLMNSILTIKKRSPVCSLILTYLPCFLWMWRGWAFSGVRTAVLLLDCNSTPMFHLLLWH